MNPRDDQAHVQMLLRMAGEAGALEDRPASAGWWRLAAAAALLAAALPALMLVTRPAPPAPAPSPLAGNASTPAPSPLGPVVRSAPAGEGEWLDDIIRQLQRETGFGTLAAGESSRAMLLAVFGDSADACGCVVWREAPFAGRSLAEVSQRELVEAAMSERCGDGAALQIVLAIEGDASHLPGSRDAAEALASCVASSPDACGSSASGLAASALSCLPAGVSVIAEDVR